jgi:hypothetical protein
MHADFSQLYRQEYSTLKPESVRQLPQDEAIIINYQFTCKGKHICMPFGGASHTSTLERSGKLESGTQADVGVDSG